MNVTNILQNKLMYNTGAYVTANTVKIILNIMVFAHIVVNETFLAWKMFGKEIDLWLVQVIII